jgi:hypothetical protein
MQKHQATQELFARVARGLVAESTIEMATEAGALVEIWTIGGALATVRASAPDRRVKAGMLLSGRLVLDDRAHRITVRVAEAVAEPGKRAALTLKVVGAEAGEPVGAGEQAVVEITGSLSPLAGLAAEAATVVGLSGQGATLLVTGGRPVVDGRYRLRFRSFEGAVEQEVAISGVHPSPRPGSSLAVCTFVDPTSETGATIERILERHASVQFRPAEDIRGSLGMSGGAAPPPQRGAGLSTRPAFRTS